MHGNNSQSNGLGVVRVKMKTAQPELDIAALAHLHPVCSLMVIALYVPLIKVREKGCHSN